MMSTIGLSKDAETGRGAYSFMFDPAIVNGRNRAHVDNGYQR